MTRPIAALAKRWKVPLAVVLGAFVWFGLRRLSSGHIQRSALHGYVAVAALLTLIVAASRRWISRGGS
jgi:hypothetical protein